MGTELVWETPGDSEAGCFSIEYVFTEESNKMSDHWQPVGERTEIKWLLAGRIELIDDTEVSLT